MKIHLHDWQKWSDPIEVLWDYGKGHVVKRYKQKRVCEICGYLQERWIDP